MADTNTKKGPESEGNYYEQRLAEARVQDMRMRESEKRYEMQTATKRELEWFLGSNFTERLSAEELQKIVQLYEAGKTGKNTFAYELQKQYEETGEVISVEDLKKMLGTYQFADIKNDKIKNAQEDKHNAQEDKHNAQEDKHNAQENKYETQKNIDTITERLRIQNARILELSEFDKKPENKGKMESWKREETEKLRQHPQFASMPAEELDTLATTQALRAHRSEFFAGLSEEKTKQLEQAFSDLDKTAKESQLPESKHDLQQALNEARPIIRRREAAEDRFASGDTREKHDVELMGHTLFMRDGRGFDLDTGESIRQKNGLQIRYRSDFEPSFEIGMKREKLSSELKPLKSWLEADHKRMAENFRLNRQLKQSYEQQRKHPLDLNDPKQREDFQQYLMDHDASLNDYLDREKSIENFSKQYERMKAIETELAGLSEKDKTRRDHNRESSRDLDHAVAKNLDTLCGYGYDLLGQEAVEHLVELSKNPLIQQKFHIERPIDLSRDFSGENNTDHKVLARLASALLGRKTDAFLKTDGMSIKSPDENGKLVDGTYLRDKFESSGVLDKWVFRKEKMWDALVSFDTNADNSQKMAKNKESHAQ